MEKDRKKMIFDEVRKKYVALTPEEWVRQHAIRYLLVEKGYPLSLMAVETAIRFQGMVRRCDIVVYRDASPYILVECKAATIQLNQETVGQIARYQSVLAVPFLFITNGMSHLFLQHTAKEKTQVIAELPEHKLGRGL